jgi:hypothetical protein
VDSLFFSNPGIITCVRRAGLIWLETPSLSESIRLLSGLSLFLVHLDSPDFSNWQIDVREPHRRKTCNFHLVSVGPGRGEPDLDSMIAASSRPTYSFAFRISHFRARITSVVLSDLKGSPGKRMKLLIG